MPLGAGVGLEWGSKDAYDLGQVERDGHPRWGDGMSTRGGREAHHVSW